MESRMIVNKFGTKRWLNEDGQLHCRPDGSEMWYQNGQLHREDGPAVIYANGSVQWWLNDKKYSFQEWANELNLDQKTRLEMVLKWNLE